MSDLSLDAEFVGYWLKLSPVEKTSLLTVAKRYVELKEGAGCVSIEQYNKEIDEAMARVENGDFVTHEQVLEIFQSRFDT